MTRTSRAMRVGSRQIIREIEISIDGIRRRQNAMCDARADAKLQNICARAPHVHYLWTNHCIPLAQLRVHDATSPFPL